MNQVKTGELIRLLRIENNFTQKQLAEKINVSDKTVSKWETGRGCPDISLLAELVSVLGVDMETLLSGEIIQKESEKGNMKKIKFYVCPECGNIITSTSEVNISCCGKTLPVLELRKAAEEEKLKITEIDGELYISSEHPMTKEHYITFGAYINENTVIIYKQYPEWNFNMRLPLYRSGRIVWYCNKCGLLYQDIK